MKDEIPEGMNEKDILELKDKGKIREDYIPPSQCEECGHQIENIMEKDDKIVIKCDMNHITEAVKDTYIVYRIGLTDCLSTLIGKILGKFDIESKKEEGDLCEIGIEQNGKTITVIFSMDSNLTEERFFEIFKNHFLDRNRIIFIYKPSVDNYKNLWQILQKLSLGNSIFYLPLEEILSDKMKDELERWINYSNKLSELEDKILENIKDEKLKQLAVSIDTNPKYILSALEALKICKISKALQDDEKWEDMEHLITLVFRYLYATDVKHGGAKQRGKSVPDNVFFVRDKDGIYITGVVDCKFSKSADLSQEKTEKYNGYLGRVRKLSMKTEKKALIFPVLDVKSKSTVKEFYNRIEKELEKGEYVIILPIDTLIVLMRTYLSIILKGKIDLKSSDFHDFVIHLFDKDFLKKITKSDSNLFSLEYELIIDELKKRVEDLSLIETAFEEIYH